MSIDLPIAVRASRIGAGFRFAGWLMVAFILIAAICLISLSIGPRYIPVCAVIDAFRLNDSNSTASIILRDYRLPRTILGLICGSALGVAGALMQALSRNPLADPGILGVNAGAAFFMTLAAGVFGWQTIDGYIWAAFAGAIIVSLVVYALAGNSRTGASAGASPVRLVLAGVAVSAVLGGIGSSITLINPQAFDTMRMWAIGSLAGRDMNVIATVTPFILSGLVIALLIAPSLNAISLGEDLARSVGANIAVTYCLALIGVTLLAGASTAAIGPIGFVGLMVPHAVRWLVGPDQRKIIPLTMVAAPVLLLTADVFGRVILHRGELEAGIITAFVGAPVLILLSRRKQASGL